jgi:hypothetical protein
VRTISKAAETALLRFFEIARVLVRLDHIASRVVNANEAHRGDGKRFVVRADEKLTAFVELERQVLTVTFYLESIR